jgi:hypothetical protein
MSHAVLMSLFYGWILLSIIGWIKIIRSKQKSPTVRTGWVVTFNSAVLYALAFNIIFFIQELFLALGKYWLGLKAVLYHNNHNWFGDHPKEFLAQGYGACSIFIAGILFGILFFAMKNNRSWVKLFVFWLAYQGLMQSLPQFGTAAVARDTDTGQAFTYLGWSDITGDILMIGSFLLVIIISLYSSGLLLRMAPAEKNIATRSLRFGYSFKMALAAGLIGIVLIFPFRIPPMGRALAPVLVTLFSVPWIFANAWRVKKVQPVNNEVNEKVLAMPIIMLVILLLIFQFILRPGIVFQA